MVITLIIFWEILDCYWGNSLQLFISRADLPNTNIPILKSVASCYYSECQFFLMVNFFLLQLQNRT